MEETKLDLLKDLGLGESFSNKTLDLIVKTEHKYVRDLRMNVKSVMESQNLSLKETHLLSIAILSNNGNQILLESMKVKAQSLGVSDLEIADAIACASLLSANNVFYRFRHFINKESYNTLPARLRMNIMMSPVLGKEFFELISLAVSAVNGCEMCVKSHEISVIEAGSTEARVWDAIRLASVITSLGKIMHD
ncbi:MAG: carboxymuconolactone decarboxylase family protein [Bacteroidetes bacterium]|jgi:alkyl hydroperoxide reductase subunit D|nr:carboxymuconolactone decarboxylase family protein [Bacteroidota bacterium]MBP7255593.1 carboxymuconolactone decarboxylase family protein [Chitinophagales bacterium]MBK7138179.1 carboxymuconolactone decarboxylase family protein [Bacteroidota bacterium]MBK7504202.1 carboxymuconolactone decarboxylase family protein [Bacteroidota bacterium]MBK7641130.1 carboxymuconolactone decarboxylase family protein [Bacteroidota bacterium]